MSLRAGEEQPEAAASQEALVQERLKEAEEKVAHLNTMIAGPPPLEVSSRPTHRGLLGYTAFGPCPSHIFG